MGDSLCRGQTCSTDFLSDAKYLSAVDKSDILSEAAWSRTYLLSTGM